MPYTRAHVCVYKRLVSLLAATAKAFVSEGVSAGCRRGNQILLGSPARILHFPRRNACPKDRVEVKRNTQDTDNKDVCRLARVLHGDDPHPDHKGFTSFHLSLSHSHTTTTTTAAAAANDNIVSFFSSDRAKIDLEQI